MGSDGTSKSEQTGLRGVRLAILVSTVLMAAGLVVNVIMPVHSATKSPAPAPAPAAVMKKAQTLAPMEPAVVEPPKRPPSDSPDYDKYFMDQALDYKLGSDFDITTLLRQQGFRGTRNWVLNTMKNSLRGSPTETVLNSHYEWMGADWASLGLQVVGPLFRGELISGADDPLPHDQALELERQIDAVFGQFYLEMVSVLTHSQAVIPSSEKVIFSYLNHTWQKDRLTAEKFLSLFGLFTSRKLHGAYMKELTMHQTPVRSLMHDEMGFSLYEPGITQSLLMTPRLVAPKHLLETCLAVGQENITSSNLDFPIELKVLVLWGKAYMATCFSGICNPFVGKRWRDIDGPLYTAYPDGKSIFRDSDRFTRSMRNCTRSVDAYIQARMSKVVDGAEKIASHLGAPWLRVDFFLDDASQDGIVLHRVRTIATSISGWTQRSERAMQVVARGFEARNRAARGKVPANMPSAARLTALGCKAEEGQRPACQAQAAAVKEASDKSTGTDKAITVASDKAVVGGKTSGKGSGKGSGKDSGKASGKGSSKSPAPSSSSSSASGRAPPPPPPQAPAQAAAAVPQPGQLP